MKAMPNRLKQRRGFMKWVAGSAGLLTLSRAARAHHTPTHFDDQVKHKLVYQCNKADPEYLEHVTFSTGEMLRKYGDDIQLVVTCIGPGIQILAKKPTRPVANDIHERVVSLAYYGVAFHACGNTMESLRWTDKDLLDFATVVPVGVDDLMKLQEDGFAYVSW